MKKLKKYVAVFMAVMLLLSSIPGMVANASDGSIAVSYTDAEKDSFKFSYNFYKTIGVINENLNIDSTITRGLWADVVVRYFGWDGSIASAAQNAFFADHNPKYDKIGSVNVAADLGLMGEYDDGKFCPDADVSYEDACVSMVKGLGYETVAESRGGGVDQYILLANELGVLKGVGGTKGYPIVASAAVKMLDNALEIKMLGVVMGKEGVFEKGDTVLSSVHQLSKKEGIVTSNYRSSLYNAEKIPSDRIGIDDVVYHYAGFTDGLVGYKVRYFVDMTTNDTVVYLGKRGNDVEVIDFDDIDSYLNRTYQYTLPNSEKQLEWEIPGGCAVIYNGVAITDGYTSNLPMYTEDGFLTLINNDSDRDVDVLLIEAYEDLWIGHIDPTTKVIYSNYDSDDFIALNTYDTVELYDSYGFETTLAKLSFKNVLSVAKTPDGETVRIDVSTETVEGKITGMITEDGETIYTINDIDYKASSVCDTTEMTVGFSGVFYLNKKQQIVGCDEKLIAPVGYLIAAHQTSGFENVVKLQVLTSSGKITVLECAKKVTVVGEEGRFDSNSLYNLLLDGQAQVKSQVILYELNQDDKVVSLDLLGHSDRLRARATLQSASLQYRSSASCFTDGKTFLNGGAVIFSVPLNGGDLEDYGVFNKADMQNEGNYCSDTIPAYAYQVNGSQLGVDVLVVDESFRSRKYGLGIVKSILQTVDEDGELYRKVEIYQYDKANTYYMYNSDFDINAIPAQSSAFPARTLEEGDVVSLDYIPVSNNRILSKVAIIYDISSDEYLYSNPSLTNYSGVTRYFYGDVQTKDNKLMAMVLRDGTMLVDEETTVGSSVNTAARNYEIHPIGGNVYVYNSNLYRDHVVKGNANDIAAYDTVGDQYSTVWMFTSNEAAQMIYVVNK